MKYKKFFLILLVSIFIISCKDDVTTPIIFENDTNIELVRLNSDGTTFEKVDMNQVSLKNDAFLSDEYALKFKNDTILNEVVNKNIEEGKLGLDSYNKLRSLAQLYNEAMTYASKNVDSTVEAYYKFKSLYESYLYFPEYKDDYGVYMPSSNESLAIVANSKGYVIVGNEIRNIKDISSYSDLQKYGKDPYYSLDDEFNEISSEDITIRKYKDRGSVFDTDWIVRGSEKLRIKLARQASNVDKKKHPRIHVEVCFRQKKALGWGNWSSRGTRISFVGNKNTPLIFGGISYSDSASGHSSHDYYIETSYKINGSTYPSIDWSLSVYYGGFNNTLSFSGFLPEFRY